MTAQTRGIIIGIGIGAVVMYMYQNRGQVPAIATIEVSTINLMLLIVLSLVNAWHNRRTARRTDAVGREVIDVKRVVGATRRCDDEPSNTATPMPGGQRWYDPPN